MTLTCHYHPHQTAYWYCPRCGHCHCQQCVIHAPQASPLAEQCFYHCPKCGNLVEFAGPPQPAVPVWRRLPEVLKCPLTPGRLLIMVGVVLTGWLYSDSETAAGLPLGLIVSVLGLAMLATAVQTLQGASKGEVKAPAPGQRGLVPILLPVMLHYLLYLTIGLGGVMIVRGVGLIPGILYFSASLAVLPAILIALATVTPTVTALNPMVWVALVRRMGGAYLALSSILAVLLGAPGALAYGIREFLPAGLPLILWGLLQSGLLIPAYHLLGEVIFQYRDLFQGDGPAIWRPPPVGALPDSEPLTWSQETLQRVDLMVGAGKIAEAIEVIQEATATRRFDDLDLSQRYLELLTLAQRRDALERHSPRHLWLLIKAGRKDAACRLYKHLISRDPQFSLHPAQLYQLACWLSERETPQASLGTLKRLVRYHPDDPLAPRAYFRIAQILYDRLKEPSQAKQILKCLLSRYPNHEIIPQVKDYLIKI